MGMSDFKRSDRVAVEIRSVLSGVLLDSIRDPRVTPLTITHVQVSTDLRHARIGVISLGGVGNTETIVEGLEAAKGFIRRELGNRVRLKYLPKLRFFADDGIDESMRIQAIIDGVRPDSNEGGES